MPTSLPLSLVVSTVILFGFVGTHMRHISNYKGASEWYKLALNISSILGIITGLSLLIFYFIQVPWYWPLVLFVTQLIIGGLLFGVLDVLAGRLGVGMLMSLVGFVVWPSMAVWSFMIVNSLTP